MLGWTTLDVERTLGSTALLTVDVERTLGATALVALDVEETLGAAALVTLDVVPYLWDGDEAEVGWAYGLLVTVATVG